MDSDGLSLSSVDTEFPGLLSPILFPENTYSLHISPFVGLIELACPGDLGKGVIQTVPAALPGSAPILTPAQTSCPLGGTDERTGAAI